MEKKIQLALHRLDGKAISLKKSTSEYCTCQLASLRWAQKELSIGEFGTYSYKLPRLKLFISYYREILEILEMFA